jgi:hypothetical protein
MERNMTARQALYIASFDSQLKWCAGIRDELTARGWKERVVVPPLRPQLSPEQVRDAGFRSVETLSWPEIRDAAVASDAVVCGLPGPVVKTFLRELSDALVRRGALGPVIVAGWVGVIIEKITAGYLDRAGADVVAVNSAKDLAHFTEVADALQLPVDNLLLAGLPFLSGTPQPERDRIRRVLFADQPTVPAARGERDFLYRKLVEYARVHPEREVRLKPRHRPAEGTFHRMRHHPEHILSGSSLPPNFRIDYEPIAKVLPRTDLLITMSSTASLEAI